MNLTQLLLALKGNQTHTPKEIIILQMLSQGEKYGLEMVHTQPTTIKKGTIYTTLNRMTQKQLITSHTTKPPPGQTGPPRRTYKITPNGKTLLKQWTKLTTK